jgi:hypothetical protein
MIQQIMKPTLAFIPSVGGAGAQDGQSGFQIQAEDGNSGTAQKLRTTTRTLCLLLQLRTKLIKA